jgi:hypothetical protein
MPRRSYWLWLIPLLLLTTWLGARGLDAYPIWWDEHYSIYNAGGAHYGPLSPSDIWTRATTDPVHPPGYAYLLAGWGALVGWNAFALRALSLFIGLLTMACLYRLSREISGSELTSLTAALTLGIGAFFIHYLHELRSYTLYALFATLLIWGYWRLLTGSTRRVDSGLFAVGVIGALYTHYLVGILAAAVGIYHLLFVPKNRHWLRAFILLIVGAVLFLPWLITFIQISGVGTGQLDTRAYTFAPFELLNLLAYSFTNGLTPLLLIAGIGVVVYWRERPVRLMVVLIMTMMALALILNAISPFINQIRYLMALWPPLALLVGYGVAWLARQRFARPLLAVLLVGWIGIGLWNSLTPQFDDYVLRDFHRDIFRPRVPVNIMFRDIAREAQPGDAAVYSAPINSFAFSGTFDLAMHPLSIRYTMPDWLPGKNQIEFTEQARRFMDDHMRVWFGVETQMPPDFRQTAFTDLLHQDFKLCKTPLQTDQLRLDLYARSAMCCGPSDAPPLVKFPNGIALASIETAQTPDILSVLLAWQIPANIPPNTYSVALHLDSANQPAIRQADSALPLIAYSCQKAVVPLNDLPPGQYTLRAVVYQWQTGQRLSGSTAATNQTEDRPAIHTITIQ